MNKLRLVDKGDLSCINLLFFHIISIGHSLSLRSFILELTKHIEILQNA